MASPPQGAGSESIPSNPKSSIAQAFASTTSSSSTLSSSSSLLPSQPPDTSRDDSNPAAAFSAFLDSVSDLDTSSFDMPSIPFHSSVPPSLSTRNSPSLISSPMSTTPIQQIITPGAAAQRALAPTPSSSSQSGIPRLNAISSSSTKSVPAFLNKLYNMVNDPSTNDLIHWSEDGTTFVVPRHEDFAREVLPRFFKHNNFSSFVRQLNMYGFHKVPHLQQGVLHSDGEGEIWEFANPHFQRNQPDLISLVTRKRGRDSDDKESHGHGTIDYNQIMAEISAIKRHQITISTDLKNIQRDNQLLWTETIATRERYQRQQETMEKIMRFLGSMLTLKKDAIVPKKNPLRLTARETTASPPMASSRANFLEPLGGSASLERGDGRDTATAGGFVPTLVELINTPPPLASDGPAGSPAPSLDLRGGLSSHNSPEMNPAFSNPRETLDAITTGVEDLDFRIENIASVLGLSSFGQVDVDDIFSNDITLDRSNADPAMQYASGFPTASTNTIGGSLAVPPRPITEIESPRLNPSLSQAPSSPPGQESAVSLLAHALSNNDPYALPPVSIAPVDTLIPVAPGNLLNESSDLSNGNASMSTDWTGSVSTQPPAFDPEIFSSFLGSQLQPQTRNMQAQVGSATNLSATNPAPAAENLSIPQQIYNALMMGGLGYAPGSQAPTARPTDSPAVSTMATPKAKTAPVAKKSKPTPPASSSERGTLHTAQKNTGANSTSPSAMTKKIASATAKPSKPIARFAKTTAKSSSAAPEIPVVATAAPLSTYSADATSSAPFNYVNASVPTQGIPLQSLISPATTNALSTTTAALSSPITINGPFLDGSASLNWFPAIFPPSKTTPSASNALTLLQPQQQQLLQLQLANLLNLNPILQNYAALASKPYPNGLLQLPVTSAPAGVDLKTGTMDPSSAINLQALASLFPATLTNEQLAGLPAQLLNPTNSSAAYSLLMPNGGASTASLGMDGTAAAAIAAPAPAPLTSGKMAESKAGKRPPNRKRKSSVSSAIEPVGETSSNHSTADRLSAVLPSDSGDMSASGKSQPGIEPIRDQRMTDASLNALFPTASDGSDGVGEPESLGPVPFMDTPDFLNLEFEDMS